jgi:hypothetical protein
MKDFIPLTTSGGENFYITFNELASGHYDARPRQLLTELSAGLGEKDKEKLAYDLAIKYIIENPLKAIRLPLLNIFHLLISDMSGVLWNATRVSRNVPHLVWYVIMVISQIYYMFIILVALLTLIYRKVLTFYKGSGILIASLLYQIGVHIFFFGDERFHHPLLPFLIIFAAIIINHRMIHKKTFSKILL